MSESPANVVIKGIVIPDVSGFRYGQQLQEQRFFEFKFRQPLFGSPLSFGTDDAASYTNEPITIHFEGAFGKMKFVSGTIVKLEFINSPGRQAEVVVTGTMYRPSNNLSKFTIFLVALLFLPLLFTGGLFWYVSHLGAALVKTEGTVSSFQDRMGKGVHKYSFKITPHRANFYRTYHTPVFNTAKADIDDLFKTADGTYEPDRTGQPVTFYVFRNDLDKLDNPNETIDFFYMKSSSRPLVKFDYYYDVLVYKTDQTGFYFIWLSYLLLEVFCFTAAFFCYKMYALDQQRKNRSIWLSCVIVAGLLNVVVLAVIL